jgi:hypothetical protein
MMAASVRRSWSMDPLICQLISCHEPAPSRPQPRHSPGTISSTSISPTADNYVDALTTNGQMNLRAQYALTGTVNGIEVLGSKGVHLDAIVPVQFPVYTVAARISGNSVQLPSPVSAGLSAGTMAYCSDGWNSGEAAGAGTGCMVQVQTKGSNRTWCAVWSGLAITN